jgi:hypothetical protein
MLLQNYYSEKKTECKRPAGGPMLVKMRGMNMHWILIEYKEVSWRNFCNKIMNLRFSQMESIFVAMFTITTLLHGGSYSVN